MTPKEVVQILNKAGCKVQKVTKDPRDTQETLYFLSDVSPGPNVLKKAATVFTKLTKYRVFISKGKAGLVIMLQKDYDKVDEDDNYPSAVSLIEGIGLVTVNLAS